MKHSEKELKLFKIIDIVGLFFVSIGTLNNFLDGVNHAPFTESILYPYTNFLVPGTNLFTVILSITYLFLPQQLWIIFFLYVLETVNLILTGFETVGIMLYTNCLAVAFASGMARKYFLPKTVVSLSFLGLLLTSLIFRCGLAGNWVKGFCEFFYNIGLSCFVIGCYFVLYQMLSDKLSFLLGDYKVPDFNPINNLPEKGSELNLKELGLTERQISCINYTINTSWNYKKIADELITSESTVKKDMQDLYKFFGVKNREMLRLLLVQYKIV